VTERIFKLQNLSRQLSQTSAAQIKLTCPGCGTFSIFEPPLKDYQDTAFFSRVRAGTASILELIAGMRLCPDNSCLASVFFVQEMTGSKKLTTYPAAGRKFDPSGVPPNVVKALLEAATCFRHELYIPAAIMLRKTLEEICHEQNCTGPNLAERLDRLKDKGLLPPALMDSLHDLRYLGNDAAHIESQTYNNVGGAEVGVGLVAIEKIVETLYQLQAIKQTLDGLKRSQSQS
jgi:hypothetical protein